MACVLVYPGLAFGLVMILSLPPLVSQSLAADTGLKSPSADSDDYAEWSNANRAYLSDNQRAREDRNPQKNDWYNFNFGVPAGATIDGIQVDVEGNNYWEANGVDIELSWDGGALYTTSGKGLIWPISGSDSYQTFGGPTDTWGRTWSDSEFSNANFRVRLTKKGSEDYYEFDVDHIQIKVYYTESGTEPGVLVYGEGAIQEPRVRDWNGSSFGDETSAQTTNNAIEWVVIRSSPDGTEMVMATVSTADKELHVQTYDGVSWTSNWSTVLDYNGKRNFDIAYENSSGDVIVVFASSPGKNIEYRRRVGGTWDPSDQTFFTPAGGASANWIKLESRPASDDIFLGVITTAPELYAYRWNGSANTWGDQFTKDATIIQEKDTESFAIAFESGSGDAFFMWGDKNQEIDYREFTTSWQAETTAYTGLDGVVKWLVAAGDPSSDKIAISALTQNIKYEFGAWTGSNWVSRPASIAGRSTSERGLDVAFEKSSGKAMYIFNETSNIYQLSWCTWTSAGGFSGVTAETGSTLEVNFMQLYSDPSSNDLLAIYSEKGEGLYHRHWNGSTWTPLDTTLEASLSRVNGMEPFMFAPYSVMPNTSPTIASAIPDTTVNQENEPIIGYRDLNNVFDDLEDGSALAFTVQSNSNPTLVTPSIDGADSTLALSFGPAQSGSSTIVIRATDSGSFWVEDSFVITVNATHVISGRVFEDIDFAGTATAYDGGASDLALANVDVELYDGTDAYLASTTTAGDGSFSFTGLADGDYSVRVRSATVGDADTPPVGGLNATVPATWPYPLAEMTWGNGSPLIGGQNAIVDDTDTGDNAGPGDTYVHVTFSGGDVPGIDFGFAYNLIVNTQDDGNADNARSDQGSLRQFIKNANAIGTAGNTTANMSQFQIPGAVPHTIQPISALPAIAEATTIDGTTDPDFSGSPLVEIDGANAGECNGLTITGSGSTVRGLVINRFTGAATGSGIYINGGDGNFIRGNYLGTDVTGTVDLGNVTNGIRLQNGAASNTIGGTAATDRNIISGNDGTGIYLRHSGTTLNVIHGNYIGLNALGTAALGNGSGIYAISGASGNTIGGTVAGAGNVISGNGNGIYFGVDNTTIQGNYIGTSASGLAAVPNTAHGVYTSGANNTIGGPTVPARNVVSGNTQTGILIADLGTTGNLVQGNFVGVDATGTGALGNGYGGVRIQSSAADNTIGGTDAAAANIVANNGRDGVALAVNAGTGNRILGNSIFANSSLGIDLNDNQDDIIDVNDPDDVDGGANGSQNYPVIISAYTDETSLITIVGTLDSSPSSTFRVEFFANDIADPSDHGEGETYLEYTDVTTDAAGLGSFSTPLNLAIAVGTHITATATDAAGNTSEFAANVMASLQPSYNVAGLVFEDVDFAGTATGWDGGSSDVAQPGVDVELYDAVNTYLASTVTDASGVFTFGGLAVGSYKVRARSATLGDVDTPPAGGYNADVPAVWPYPLAEMTWAYGGALIGGQDTTVDDTATGDDAGPGDTYVTVTVSGADVSGVNFGFNYELIVNVDDDANADNIRSKQGTLRQFIKNSNAITGVNKSWFQIP